MQIKFSLNEITQMVQDGKAVLQHEANFRGACDNIRLKIDSMGINKLIDVSSFLQLINSGVLELDFTVK